MGWLKNRTFRRVIAETNIFDLAIGLTVAYVFVDLVNSFVANIFSPIISALIGKQSLSDWKVDLQFFESGYPYTLRYGMFLDALIQFFLVYLVAYCVARVLLRFKKNWEKTHSINCPCCQMKIPLQAKQCPYCQTAQGKNTFPS